MGYSLSTSWNSSRHADGADLVNEIIATGFDTVELNFSLTAKTVDDIARLVAASRIRVSSLHNICPLPEEIAPEKASPDFYSLASCDDAERRRAVAVTKGTIDCARRLGAGAVVVHAGRVAVRDRTRELSAAAGNAAQSDAIRREMVAERSRLRQAHFDNVLKSLDELVSYARGAGVAIGIENRYYYREIPILEEFETIFRAFPAGSGIGYWHDVGHAEVFDRLGLCKHADLLGRFGNRLLGIHLHDIIGSIHDHMPPGLGTFDFRLVRPYLNDSVLKVIEAHQPATGAEIRRSADYLRKLLGD